jgi:hypothetical protein
MVAPKEQALDCQSCHGAQSRLAGLGGIYMPGFHHSAWLDRLGWLVVLLTLLGVGAHGVARLLLKGRKRP